MVANKNGNVPSKKFFETLLIVTLCTLQFRLLKMFFHNGGKEPLGVVLGE